MGSFETTAWGKFEDAKGTHHLVHHMADVAACFLALAKLPVWRNRLELAAGQEFSERQIERLACLAFLHDIGKLSPGFQCQRKIWGEESVRSLGREGARCNGAVGHAQAGAELLLPGCPRKPVADIQEALFVDEIWSWGDGEEVTGNLLLASFAHHGRPLREIRDGRDVADSFMPLGDYQPLPHAQTIGRLMRGWFPVAFGDVGSIEELPESAAFLHLFAGMVSLADWVGSDREFFGFVAEADEGYIDLAKERALHALKAVGLDIAAQRRACVEPVSFKCLTEYDQPNPQQVAMGEVSTDAQFLILEAETGSGKTEAALWRFIKLYEAGKVDGLYFAVPTRTAAVQLQTRVHEAAKRVFGKAQAPETVLAVPGYYKAGEHFGRPLENWQVLWDDDGRGNDEQVARRWAAEHSKRYLAAQLAVGTIDQAMLGVLMVKHAHLRASSMARSLLVIDEVHSSDIYMSHIQQRLIEDHMKIGGYVLAMSATLGSAARNKWFGITKTLPFSQAKKTGYPAIWLKGESEPVLPGDSGMERKKDVVMSQLESMAADNVAQAALAAARDGAKLLVIRNTVKEACKAFNAIEAALGEDEKQLLFAVNDIPTLHHSRFGAEDRRLLDARVEALLGKKGERPDHGLIIVGTQTLEQSLDICADYMITDLCPVDVLLQRIGRLHRHGKNPRPRGYENPQCLVLLPDEGLEKCMDGMINGLGGWTSHDGCLSGIYMDVAGLELTRRLIECKPVWRIPAMNRELVEGGTHPEKIEALVEELGEQWRDYSGKLLAGKLADGSAAKLGMFSRDEDFEELGFPDDEKIRTRLSEDGRQLEFAEPFTGPFGEKVTKLTLPSHWSRGIPADAEPLVHNRAEGGVEISVGILSFYYNVLGIEEMSS